MHACYSVSTSWSLIHLNCALFFKEKSSFLLIETLIGRECGFSVNVVPKIVADHYMGALYTVIVLETFSRDY